ncbi:MAG: hypothetical protein AAF798_16545 [Bacteroidota bacterium]
MNYYAFLRYKQWTCTLKNEAFSLKNGEAEIASSFDEYHDLIRDVTSLCHSGALYEDPQLYIVNDKKRIKIAIPKKEIILLFNFFRDISFYIDQSFDWREEKQNVIQDIEQRYLKQTDQWSHLLN